MYFEVEGMTFEGSALVASLSDWTHATTSACMRVEHGLVLCGYFLVAEVGHGRGHDVKAPVGISGEKHLQLNLRKEEEGDKGAREVGEGKKGRLRGNWTRRRG